MEQTKIAEQTTEFVDLMQRAQSLVQRSSANAMAKATGKEFSVLDAGTISTSLCPRRHATGRRPLCAGAVPDGPVERQRQGLAEETWSSSGEDSGDRRFRDGRWSADPLSRGLRDLRLAVENAAERSARCPKVTRTACA